MPPPASPKEVGGFFCVLHGPTAAKKRDFELLRTGKTGRGTEKDRRNRSNFGPEARSVGEIYLCKGMERKEKLKRTVCQGGGKKMGDVVR